MTDLNKFDLSQWRQIPNQQSPEVKLMNETWAAAMRQVQQQAINANHLAETRVYQMEVHRLRAALQQIIDRGGSHNCASTGDAPCAWSVICIATKALAKME